MKTEYKLSGVHWLFWLPILAKFSINGTAIILSFSLGFVINGILLTTYWLMTTPKPRIKKWSCSFPPIFYKLLTDNQYKYEAKL
jgi:Flp pilus assembly protein TadB